MPAPIQRQWTTSVSATELMGRVRQETELIPTGFTLTHRLSGAGVVVRTLTAPETNRPYFGRVFDDSFHIAAVPSPADVTPFHPILRARLAATASGGTLITAELAHHPNARTWAPLYLFGAVALGGGAAVAALDNPPMLVGGLGLSALFATFPTLQARMRFRQSVDRAAARFAEQFELQPVP